MANLSPTTEVDDVFTKQGNNWKSQDHQKKEDCEYGSSSSNSKASNRTLFDEILTTTTSSTSSNGSISIFTNIQLQRQGQPLGTKDAKNGNGFQYNQIPLPQQRRRTTRDNNRGQYYHQNQNTFLERFRSQINISDESSPKILQKNGSCSQSVLTSPIDIFPGGNSSPSSSYKGGLGAGHGSTGDFFPSGIGHPPKGQGQRRSSVKPKKWFSFTNLLNKQNLSGILNLPKSRLSVSSTLNSVFVGPTSPSPSASDSVGGSFFGGLTNLGYDGGTPSAGGIGGKFSHQNPISPTHSSSSGPPGDFRSPFGEFQGQVVFRRKSGGPLRSEVTSSGGKHYSSGGSCGESVSERSSGGGYYTGHSSSSSTGGGGGIGFINSGGTGGSSGGGSSRLSCGEFFTGTPNSPICSGETSSEFQFSGNSSGYCSSRGEHGTDIASRSCSASNEAFYNYHKSIGRSLPTLLESMETGMSSQGSSDGGGGSGHITVDTVVELMYQEFAVLTGAKSRDDHYIMTFPDRGNFQLLTDEDYKRLMMYLTAVPPMHDAESGFVIIIDRRNDKWNSVKTTLVRISNYFPGLIHRVFVLRPVGMFQKALSEISSRLFRTENLRFRLTVCHSITDLFAFVDPCQLTNDLGGLLFYDKVKWVQQRIEVEGFHIALQSLSKDLKNFTEVFQDFEYPNDVSSTEALISQKTQDFERLQSDLSQAVEHGENLLQRIKTASRSSTSSNNENGKSSNNGNSRMKNGGGGATSKGPKSMTRSNSSVQLINVISVERYIIQIEETTRLFKDFWMKEVFSLDQCLRLRRFEQDFKEMQGSFDCNMKRLENLGEMGESLGATDVLIAETLALETIAIDDVNRALKLEQVGKEIVECNPSAVDTVEPKRLELSSMSSQFQTLFNEKIQKQKRWREIQATIEKANQLCNDGMDLLSCQITDVSEDSTDGNSCGDAIIVRIDDFLTKIRLMAEELTHLKTNLSSPTNSQSKPLVKQVLKRVEDVQLMCIKRKSAITQQISKLTKSRRSSGSSFASTPSSSSQNAYSNSNSELKSAKSTSTLDTSMDEYTGPTNLRSGSSSLSLDGSSSGISTHKIINQQDTEWELRQIKRGHVLNELMQTERSYVEEIGEILTEYRDQMKNPEVKQLLPQQLQPNITPTKLQRQSPNVAVLFCNLDEIYAFHSKLFLPDLSNCVGSVELVGLCFIQRHSDFLALYSQYCQLLPASEALRKEIGENHAWFMACRNRLGHKLPLGAYLLKPVQRITKYHLLLKDLVKTSEGCEGYAELVEALECMLVVLRCVNDGMHQLGITGYPGKLIEEGYLLLQGSFLMWTENKKDRLRLKGHQRHLFLYQRSILICKKVPKSSLYEFRTKLSLMEVGLTEALKGSGASKKFEIWVNGRQKVFLFQAENQEMKDIWVREVKKLLTEQLESIRARKSQTIAIGTGASSMAASIAAGVLPITAARRQKMMSKGITVNGWRSSNIGHRALRQVSSWDNPDPIGRPKSRSTDCELEDEFWSSEISNSDEEDSIATPPSRPLSIGEEPEHSEQPCSSLNSMYGIGEKIENSPKYIALADYSAMGPAEVSLKEGNIVSLVKVGCGGWWFVKSISPAIPFEGWAPSAYLEKHNDNNSNNTPFYPSSSNIQLTQLHHQSPSNKSENNKDLNQYLNQMRSASIPGTSRILQGGGQTKLSQSTEDILSALR